MRIYGGGRMGDSVLIVIPGAVNYFYNQCGRRMAEALRQAGYRVDLADVNDIPDREYDAAIVSNVFETLNAGGAEGQPENRKRLARVRESSRFLACVVMDCARAHWFQTNHGLADEIGADLILDLGMVDQSASIDPDRKTPYGFAFCGLTGSEVVTTEAAARDATDRPVPWAFVGHSTYNRVALVDYVIQTVDPRGFVYIPPLGPVTEAGSPHINQQQYEMVLKRTKYQLWCSHHSHFYMETERVRTSVLTGSVPIKVVNSLASVPEDAPLRYLMSEPQGLREVLDPDTFRATRRRLIADWLAFPRLADELDRVVGGFGAAVPSRPAARVRAA